MIPFTNDLGLRDYRADVAPARVPLARWWTWAAIACLAGLVGRLALK